MPKNKPKPEVSSSAVSNLRTSAKVTASARRNRPSSQGMIAITDKALKDRGGEQREELDQKTWTQRYFMDWVRSRIRNKRKVLNHQPKRRVRKIVSFVECQTAVALERGRTIEDACRSGEFGAEVQTIALYLCCRDSGMCSG